jgi:hypothetical protein
MNARTDKNLEQMTLINDPELYSWHAAWITDKVNGR